jgi:hypothetical protein
VQSARQILEGEDEDEDEDEDGAEEKGDEWKDGKARDECAASAMTRQLCVSSPLYSIPHARRAFWPRRGFFFSTT